MSANQLLVRLAARGIKLRAVDDRIQAMPKSALSLDEQEDLRQLKWEVLRLIRGDELLGSRERLCMMAETVERLHHLHGDRRIDWGLADKINTKIGETVLKRELTSLLHEYSAVISGQFFQ